MIFIYILIAIILFFCFKLLQAKHFLRQIKEKNEFHLLKIEQALMLEPDNPILYCIRGSIYQRSQNFILANIDYKKALSMITDKTEYKGKNLKSILFGNIKYTEKPHPWVKGGPKDLSNSGLAYYLIDRFGYLRYNF